MHNLKPQEKETVNTLKIKTLIMICLSIFSFYMSFAVPDFVRNTPMHESNIKFLILIHIMFSLILLFISYINYKTLLPYKNQKFLPLTEVSDLENKSFENIVTDFPELNKFKNDCLNKNNLITQFDLEQAILYTQDVLKKRHPYLNFENKSN
jgi:hypothetical protein